MPIKSTAFSERIPCGRTASIPVPNISFVRTGNHRSDLQYNFGTNQVRKEESSLLDFKRVKGCGIAKTKSQLSRLDILVAFLSISCCAVATTVVVHHHTAWSLGITYQLVVAGFLLSIMNLCLGYIAPTFFLLCERRYGTSTLQNYDAILRSKPSGSHICWHWRVMLVLLTLLPLGLSAAYKLFVGGISTNTIGLENALYSDEYGLYPAPGLLPALGTTGSGIMINASLPFLLATWANTSALPDNATIGDPAFDPPLPAFPKAYGFNTLLLSEKTVAMLDVPIPTWLNKIQAALGPEEYWNISATVTATVSIYNDTIDQHRELKSEDDTYWDYYNNQTNYPTTDGGFGSTKLWNGWNVGVMSSQWGPDETWCFVGIYPDPAEDLASFAPYAKLYDTIRTPCNGTWTVTRGAIELVDGNCDLDPRARPNEFERDQVVLRDNALYLWQFYLPTLMEYLGPFASIRNESRWLTASITTVVGAMKWSKITSLDSPIRQDFTQRGDGKYLDAGLRYSTQPIIVSARPTLRRSWGLFLLFAFQPLITIAMVIANIMLYKVPIGKGFGMIAVLAGIDPVTVGALKGGGFSGELSKRVKLNIDVMDQEDRSGELIYTLGEDEATTGRSIRRRWRYA